MFSCTVTGFKIVAEDPILFMQHVKERKCVGKLLQHSKPLPQPLHHAVNLFCFTCITAVCMKFYEGQRDICMMQFGHPGVEREPFFTFCLSVLLRNLYVAGYGM